MKKRLISLAFILALIICAVPAAGFTQVSAKAMSNAGALTPLDYKKGSYVALGKLTVYTASDGKNSTGKKIPLYYGSSFAYLSAVASMAIFRGIR